MKTKLIIIDGQNGAGKSTVAELLHAKLPFTALIHWDKAKKFISDFKPNQKYHEITAEVAHAMIGVYLKNKVSVIYEAFFGTGEFVEHAVKLHKKNARIYVYQIEAPFEVRMRRVKERYLSGKKKRLLSKSHVTKNDLFYAAKKYATAKVFDSSKMKADKIAKEILADLK